MTGANVTPLPTWPDGVAPGRRVRATAKDGSLVVEATVDRIDGDLELVVARPSGHHAGYLGIYPRTFTVEVLPDPVPTAKGIYVDNEGDYWLVETEGEQPKFWSKFSGLTDPGVFDPAKYTLTPLVPRTAP